MPCDLSVDCCDCRSLTYDSVLYKDIYPGKKFTEMTTMGIITIMVSHCPNEHVTLTEHHIKSSGFERMCFFDIGLHHDAIDKSLNSTMA